MVTMAQRMEQLRTERGESRPALSAALGFPKTAMEKFETGRQTPSQEQQEKLAAYFGVSLFYLRGESDDRTQQLTWMDAVCADDAPPPAPLRPQRQTLREETPSGEQSTVFDAFLTSKKFKESLRTAVLEVLRSPEGQDLVARAVRSELRQKR